MQKTMGGIGDEVLDAGDDRGGTGDGAMDAGEDSGRTGHAKPNGDFIGEGS